MGKKLYMLAAYLFTMLFAVSAASPINISNITNSSVVNSTTTIPLEYRAIVGIVLIIVIIVLALKFAKFVISLILLLIIIAIVLSTAYYFFQTGTISIHNSLAFLSNIYNFFTSAGHTISAISNITSKVSGIASKLNASK